jgi:hypothetical protein
MTWHANCACWRHSYIMMTSSWASLLCMMTSQLCHPDIITIRVRHMGRVVWYLGRVGSAHPGEDDAWRASMHVANHPTGAWRRMRPFMTSDFIVVFTSGFVSSFSTQWYGQNTILTTFIFEQNQTPLKPYALIPIVGDSSSPCTDWWCSDSCSKEAKHTETQDLTWFGKTAYIHGRESILFRD